MHAIKLITLDPTLKRWRTLPRKLGNVLDELNTMDNADFYVETDYRDLIPHVVGGRITREWMDSVSAPELRRGYEFVAVHMGMKQMEQLGIQPSLRGAHQKDFDLVHECYFWADEHTKRMGRNQFEEVFKHELRHGLRRGMKLPDDTHERHADGTLRGDFVGMDMAAYSPRKRNLEQQVSLLTQAVALLQQWQLLKRPTLYRAAVARLGTDASPADLAPDMLGCAESVSNIVRDVLPDFPIITGTWTLCDELEDDPRFERVSIPLPGTIIISPTGTVKSAAVPNGHVGIYGLNGEIMSNDSRYGLWEANYTRESWEARWGKAGYPTYLFRLR